MLQKVVHVITTGIIRLRMFLLYQKSIFLFASNLVYHLEFFLFPLFFLAQVLLSFESNGNLEPVFLLVSLSFGSSLYLPTCFYQICTYPRELHDERPFTRT